MSDVRGLAQVSGTLKIIYGTVIYETRFLNRYLEEFLQSVKNQTYQDFLLLLINDDVSPSRLVDLIDALHINLELDIVNTNGALSPARLRERLVQEAYKRDGDLLLFADFDDTVTENRVQEVVRQIGDFSFSYQDFYIVDSGNTIISDRSFYKTRDIPETLDTVMPLMNSNFLGLGGLTLNLRKLDFANIHIPDDILAVDWFLPTRILLDGGKGREIKGAYSFYRQHSDSFIGIKFKLTDGNFFQGVKVKKAHYNYFATRKNREQKKYRKLFEDICNLEEHLTDKSKRYAYIDCINTQFTTERFTWWENIKTLKEMKDA